MPNTFTTILQDYLGMGSRIEGSLEQVAGQAQQQSVQIPNTNYWTFQTIPYNATVPQYTNEYIRGLQNQINDVASLINQNQAAFGSSYYLYPPVPEVAITSGWYKNSDKKTRVVKSRMPEWF